MSTDTPKLVMLTGFNNRSYKYISKNRMRFIFLLIKRFSGGVVGAEPCTWVPYYYRMYKMLPKKGPYSRAQ